MILHYERKHKRDMFWKGMIGKFDDWDHWERFVKERAAEGWEVRKPEQMKDDTFEQKKDG